VLLTLLNVIDFDLNLEQAVEAPRFHHQWLPDEMVYESPGFSPDTLRLLQGWGHSIRLGSGRQGFVAAIRRDPTTGWLEGVADRRGADSAAAGW
jgi:gamma-glutamyltranspeptidase/glutathione hydrolase